MPKLDHKHLRAFDDVTHAAEVDGIAGILMQSLSTKTDQ
jgi:hypothetical protein